MRTEDETNDPESETLREGEVGVGDDGSPVGDPLRLVEVSRVDLAAVVLPRQ